jgi:hypothetical protein
MPILKTSQLGLLLSYYHSSILCAPSLILQYDTQREPRFSQLFPFDARWKLSNGTLFAGYASDDG